MNTPIPPTSQPAIRAFAEAGITTLEDMTRWREKDLLALHGVGPKVIRAIREELTARGLRFRE